MNTTIRQQLWSRVGLIMSVVLAAALLLAAILILSNPAGASSHREAPAISKDAFADNTDTYVFVSPNDSNRLALIASWIPFEGPEGGPNYFEWDPNVQYHIHLDTNGDATSDVTYTLSSDVMVGNPDTFLYNVGPIESPLASDSDWNRRQFYTVTEQFAPGSEPAGVAPTNILVDTQLAPPANIGSKSTPDYLSLEADATYNYIDGGNGDSIDVFAGATDDAFFVDLQVFDLLTLRGQSPPIGYDPNSGPTTPVDSLTGFNVHSLVVEVPISRLTSAHGDPVVGVWASSTRSSMTTLAPAGGQTTSGLQVQVSRLGMPLVNEVVLPMGLKDVFNGIPPEVDLTVYASLQESVEDPEVGNLLCALYGVPLPGDSGADCDTDYTPGVPRSGRGDIFDIYLTGMVLENPFTITLNNGMTTTLPAGFNVNRPAGIVPAEMIRINTSISGSLCAPQPRPLGVLAGDACGFPNGRRLRDDTVDISLLAVAGAAYEVLDDRDAAFAFNTALIDVLSDNVDRNDKPPRDTFPYIPAAQSGQSHVHKNSSRVIFMAAVFGFVGLPAAGLFVWRRKQNDELTAELDV
jgi:hypothetical protein